MTNVTELDLFSGRTAVGEELTKRLAYGLTVKPDERPHKAAVG